ncbi:MAG: (d)CMP kinase [Legionella sp.]|nr:(d)CMP kinase [Legionella sp.]
MFDKNQMVITLDGPSGTGKGTLCHLLAKHLHWNLLDSGVIYRALAYAALKREIDFQDTLKLVDLARSLDLKFDSKDNQSAVFLDDEEVSQLLRSEQCGENASQIAQISEVRLALLKRQRRFAVAPGLVTDGRDMGTVVFPKAILKIFLYASVEERASRRHLQLKDKGIHGSLAQVVEELQKRDTRDTTRLHAPLKAAEDAVQIDTTGLTIAQVFEIVTNLVVKRGIVPVI